MKDELILVDAQDQEIGTASKQEAHEKALMHRAFSVFIFRQTEQGCELLLQQRNLEKYHCGGLWTNTCCSHPRPGEETLEAGKRRLFEEMGFEVDLTYAGVFHYIAKFDNGLTENEVDHVLVGWYKDEMIQPNKDEVADYRWVSAAEIENQIKAQPKAYTPWFAQALSIALKEKE